MSGVNVVGPNLGWCNVLKEKGRLRPGRKPCMWGATVAENLTASKVFFSSFRSIESVYQ